MKSAIKQFKEIYTGMINEGGERYDIQLIIDGNAVMIQKDTDKSGFEKTLKGTIASFGKESVESKFGPKGYIKVVTK
jgi:hypothetical protein